MTGTGGMAVAYAGSVAAALVTLVFSVRNRGRTPAALYLAVAMTAFAGRALADLVFMVARFWPSARACPSRSPPSSCSPAP